LDFSRVPLPAAMIAIATRRGAWVSAVEVERFGIGFNITRVSIPAQVPIATGGCYSQFLPTLSH
jgi:hypothetical protein